MSDSSDARALLLHVVVSSSEKGRKGRKGRRRRMMMMIMMNSSLRSSE
jgi:hypothetical protein